MWSWWIWTFDEICFFRAPNGVGFHPQISSAYDVGRFFFSRDVTSWPDLTNQRVGGVVKRKTAWWIMMVLLLKSFLEPTRNLRDPTGLKKCKAKIRAFAKRTTVTCPLGRVSKCRVTRSTICSEFMEDLFFLNQVFSDQRLGVFQYIIKGCLMFMISYFDLKNYDVLMFQHH